MEYFTRLRVRREHQWLGEPLAYNRKLNVHYYDSLAIRVEGDPRRTIIKTGAHIYIEGDDDDNPYVAKVIRLFDSGKQKKAEVEWFARVFEVPSSKLKLLGREPHPQEIFYYKGHSCDDEVDVSSILRPVQVKHVDAAAPFPDSSDKDTLYVKLSWDSKTFRKVDPSPVESFSSVRHPKPSLPPSSPSSLNAVTPTSRGSSRHVLPMPDPVVMRAAMSGEVTLSRTSRSASKGGSAEAESLHLASKLSASKSLSAKRRSTVARTPGVRKRLELSSPEKSTSGNKAPSQSLDEDLEAKVMLTTRLSPSPPKATRLSHKLTPLRKSTKLPATQTSSSIKPSSKSLTKLFPRERDSLPSSAEEDSTRAEVENEKSPMLPEVDTPRSSKRKSAMLVSSRIRKQLKLMDSQTHMNSDGEDDDEFVLSKKDLETSSEDEEEDGGLDSEEELVVKKGRCSAAALPTPLSKQKTGSLSRTPLKTPSKKITAGTPRTPHHATPSIPSRSLPARDPANVLEEAKIRLHVSSVPESLPCREQEFQDIYSFIESKILDGTGGCMYISGVPGTGKTATVHEVMRCLQHAADMDEIPPFHFVEINGMKMTDPHQAYVQILQKLTGQKATTDHAAALLEKRFSCPAPRKETTVLLVDELDLLWTRKQNVMYNLFDWPTRRHARLVVLTIANTMDLPERIMINRVASRLGLTRMSFQPYSFKQLQQIIMSRLNKLKAFEEDALQLVSRKVAALSGDARRCLDICRRATEICEHSALDASATGLVGMNHVMEALNEMFSSAYVTAIKCASTQEQLFIRAVITEFRRLGLEEATFQQVFVQHQDLCRVEGLQPINVSEGLAVCQRLGACRLLLLESSRLGVLQRIRLNVSEDDILFALKAD
ncbi:origin recognition complex subunit 1 isoform 2-T2 [Pholidichthys leucotaenia]